MIGSKVTHCQDFKTTVASRDWQAVAQCLAMIMQQQIPKMSPSHKIIPQWPQIVSRGAFFSGDYIYR